MTDEPSSQMYPTILREPDDLRAILARGWERPEWAARILAGARRVYTIGTGTSYHAALHAAHAFRLAGLDAWAVHSFDFASYPVALDGADAAVFFAHTGKTRYTALSMERAKSAGLRVVAVTGTDSPTDDAIAIRTVAPEKSAAYTASHTAAVFVAAQIAFAAGRLSGSLTGESASEFEAAPERLAALLERRGEVREVAAFGLPRRTFCAGAGADGFLALECALKAREAAYTTIDGMATEQFIHGPMITINADDLAILFATETAGADRTRDLAGMLEPIGTPAWVVGDLGNVKTRWRFEIGPAHPLLVPVFGLAAVQLYACYQAHLGGTNADSFREDVPAYAEAMKRLPAF